jgi:hypothetical protein
VSRFALEDTIAGTPDEIWEYAADIRRHPEWMAVTDARIVRGDGTQAGARGRERMRFGPFDWDIEFEVAEAAPGRRLAWKNVSGAPFDMVVSLDLEAIAADRTKATYAAEIRLHGPWRLFAPLVAMEGKTGPEGELRRLKAHFEPQTTGVQP